MYSPSTFAPTHLPALRLDDLPVLTALPPLESCRVCVIIPVRNEAENLPAVISALAQQIDENGERIAPDCYEVLVLANNCSDDTVAIAHSLSRRYPNLQLHTIEVSLPKAQAFVGKARQMVMHEAYRRFSMIGLKNRIIASTDGDTEVSPNWISALIKEFDKGIDAVGGRIITRRSATPGINTGISLYYLRRLAHTYLSSQLECLLDPQTHDCWPRHFQYCGANMAVSAQMYGKVGGMPLVKDEEDVALYCRLKQADAKIRHSLSVRVLTSARRTGRATGGLAELLEELAERSQKRQIVLVESPQLTESRILICRQLRQTWAAIHKRNSFTISSYARTADLLAKSLGVSSARLRHEMEQAVTFGWLVEALATHQKQNIDSKILAKATTEISLANMHLRQRLQSIRQQRLDATNPYVVLQTLQQIQSIPLFSFTH